MISPTALAPHLADYLPRQRWFGAKDRTIELVRVLDEPYSLPTSARAGLQEHGVPDVVRGRAGLRH